MNLPRRELSLKYPPLLEVAFSVQFEPISGFHIGLMGLVWNEFRNRYPTLETAEELRHEIEKYGVITRKPQGLKLFEKLPIPRLKFISDDSQYVIQIQSDRFIFNWRRAFDERLEYPRYPNVKKMFEDELAIFHSFLNANHLGSPAYDQVEITYVNHIEASGRSIEHVFKDVIDESRYPSSLKLEGFSINLKQVISADEKNFGRLYTTIEKANRVSDGTELFVLNFFARCQPDAPSVEGVFRAMDISRDVINSCFSAITTKAMQDEWNQGEAKS